MAERERDDILPPEAIQWLKDMGYTEASHEERIWLLKEAKEMFLPE